MSAHHKARSWHCYARITAARARSPSRAATSEGAWLNARTGEAIDAGVIGSIARLDSQSNLKPLASA